MDRIDFPTLRILVLSAKIHAAQTLRTVLGIAGVAKIFTVDETRRALEMLSVEHYDAFFCAEESEPFDGLSVAMAVRRSGRALNPLIPIFVFHAGARRRHVEAARDMGATAFITCPISPRTVMVKLEAALRSPRPFIRAEQFFGPDRRATERAGYFGGESRRRQPRKVRVVRRARDALTPVADR